MGEVSCLREEEGGVSSGYHDDMPSETAVHRASERAVSNDAYCNSDISPKEVYFVIIIDSWHMS